MGASIYPGTQEAAKILDSLKKRVVSLPIRPRLSVVMVGNDARSEAYIKRKQQAAHSVEVEVAVVRPEPTQGSVLDAVGKLGDDREVHGIIVQLPVPDGVHKEEILAVIPPEKDVDGLNPTNLGRLMLGLPCHTPATVKAIMAALDYANFALSGARVGIVGYGVLVGRPLSALLLQKGATVTVCTLTERNLAAVLKTKDVIIAAAGKAHLITPGMVKPGAIVIDVGISSMGGKLLGDVHPNVAKKASFITPVIGGIGPVNVACLLENTVQSCERTCASRSR